MKLSTSTQSLDQRLCLHDFKMNLARTLHSEQLQKFTSTTTPDMQQIITSTTKKSSSHKKHRLNHKKPMAPRIPVKVTSAYSTFTDNHDDHDNDETQTQVDDSTSSLHSSSYYTYSSPLVIKADTTQMIKSKCDSPFLLRKIPRANSSGDNLFKRCDSGLSSLSSAQMFFAEISEFWPPPPPRQTPSTSSTNLTNTNTTSSSNNSTFYYFTNKFGLVK